MSDWIIRSIPSDDYLEESSRVIRDSFAGVAAEFSLTWDNCPTNPAFQSSARLKEARKKGLRLFGLFEDTVQTGFVAVEHARKDIYCLERLAVLPDYRHAGRGAALVEFVIAYVRNRGGKIVSLGTIAGNARLKEWYKGLGFIEGETTRVKDLPFEVSFMDISVDLPHMPPEAGDL